MNWEPAAHFVVGKLARSQPEFIAEIAARGHEIAYHSHAHIPLDRDTPNNFRKETEADKAFIEETTGQPVVGIGRLFGRW